MITLAEILELLNEIIKEYKNNRIINSNDFIDLKITKKGILAKLVHSNIPLVYFPSYLQV